MRLKREFTVRNSEKGYSDLLTIGTKDISRMKLEFARNYEELF